MSALLELSGIVKSFGPIKVLKEIGFDVRAGEVHALLGENGAGKSTLVKIIAGVIPADEGEVRLDGKQVRFASPREAAAAGIATVYQELLLFPDLTVAENIYLGHAPKTRWGTLDWPAMRAGARALLDSLDSPDLDVDALVGKLSVANRQRVEIAKALSHDAKLVIMDEPTAALADADAHRLMDIVRRLRDRGVGIIYVSHRLPEIFALADRVTVLRDGEYVGTVDAATTGMATIIGMMVGRTISDERLVGASEPGEVALDVRRLECGPLVRDVSFSVRRGEILGFAGLMGAGRTEVARAVFGADRLQSGEIFVHGKRCAVRTPEHAVAAGIGYLSEDRKRFGLALGMDVEANVVMSNLSRYLSFAGFLKSKPMRRAAEKFIRLLNIRTPSAAQEVRLLSGGNQQKVVVAKWLDRDCDILFFDEPTRGIDVGAKSEIYKLLRTLADQGKAIVMISSELPEILRMSDRIIVMCEGRITGELAAEQATQERIMELATRREAAKAA